MISVFKVYVIEYPYLTFSRKGPVYERMKNRENQETIKILKMSMMMIIQIIIPMTTLQTNQSHVEILESITTRFTKITKNCCTKNFREKHIVNLLRNLKQPVLNKVF